MDDNGYRKDNNCPYCDYFCDAATITGLKDKTAVPKEGDLSFCLMCCNPMRFGENMILEKFDINSLDKAEERNKLGEIRVMMELFWVTQPIKEKERRETYLENLVRNKT